MEWEMICCNCAHVWKQGCSSARFCPNCGEAMVRYKASRPVYGYELTLRGLRRTVGWISWWFNKLRGGV